MDTVLSQSGRDQHDVDEDSDGNSDEPRTRGSRPVWRPDRSMGPITYLAYCLLRAALRPVLRTPEKPVLVGLVIPDWLPALTAEKVLSVHMRTSHRLNVVDGVPRASSSVRQMKEATAELARSVRSEVSRRRQVVLLVDDVARIPADTKAHMDRVIELGRPSPNHIKALCHAIIGAKPDAELLKALVALPVADLPLVLREGRTLADIEIHLQRHAERLKQDARNQPSLTETITLDHLFGMDEAVGWGRDLARDLQAWRTGEIAWGAVDPGALLVGPPGTGKTLFAGGLARSCSVPLIASSVGQWQASGHLGDMLAAMKKSFAEASRAVPSILFIDELDAIGDRNRLGGDHASYSRQVINFLLELLDGIDRRHGVIVLGACNDATNIDPALLRSGRLDRIISIALPEVNARLGILRSHLGSDLTDLELSLVAARTAGSSGADLERLVRNSRRKARQARRPLVVDGLLAELPAPVPITPDILWRTAVHEVGHAIVAELDPSTELIDVEIGKEIGQLSIPGGLTRTTAHFRPLLTASDIAARVTLTMAGIAAEELVFGNRSTGAVSDLQQATQLAAQMEFELGLGETLATFAGTNATKSGLLQHRPDLAARVEKRLADALQQARTILTPHRRALETIARKIVKVGKVDARDVRRAIRAGRK